MKTQITNSKIITVALMLLIVLWAAPQAGAQRRTITNNQENVVKQSEKKESKSRDSKRDIKKTEKHYDKQKNHKPEWNRKDNDDRAFNERKHFDDHRDKKHIDKDIHVRVDPFPHREIRRHHVKPRPHICFRTMPRKAVWVMLEGNSYAFYRGKFYLPSPFGFYRATPPVYLQTLPEGCFRVIVNGQPMFRYHGILFIETPMGFKVIV